MRDTKVVADFIRTMTIELTDMAREADLRDLGYLLTLASLEAKRSLAPSKGNAKRKSQSSGRRGDNARRRAPTSRRQGANSRKRPAS